MRLYSISIALALSSLTCGCGTFVNGPVIHDPPARVGDIAIASWETVSNQKGKVVQLTVHEQKGANSGESTWKLRAGGRIPGAVFKEGTYTGYTLVSGENLAPTIIGVCEFTELKTGHQVFLIDYGDGDGLISNRSPLPANEKD